MFSGITSCRPRRNYTGRLLGNFPSKFMALACLADTQAPQDVRELLRVEVLNSKTAPQLSHAGLHHTRRQEHEASIGPQNVAQVLQGEILQNSCLIFLLIDSFFALLKPFPSAHWTE